MKILLRKLTPLLLLLTIPALGQIAPDTAQVQGLVHLPRPTVMNYARRLTVAEELDLATKMLEEVRDQNSTDTTEIGNVLAVLRDVNRYQFRADSIQREEQQKRISADSLQRVQQQMATKQNQTTESDSSSAIWLILLLLLGVAGAGYVYFVLLKKKPAPASTPDDGSGPGPDASENE